MIAGFTGTRKGMTTAQKIRFRELISTLQVAKFVHGDCIGADADAHRMIAIRGSIPIHKRPSNIGSRRAFCSSGVSTCSKPVDPLLRNKKIAEDCNILIVTPSGDQEVLRSGTWATVRYARKLRRRIHIIFPDGSERVEQ